MDLLFRCSGCGATVAGSDGPFRCPAAAGRNDVDHVLVRSAAPPTGRGPRGEAELFDAGRPSGNPFERYRRRLSFWALGRSHGVDDEALVALVRDLDRRVADVDGRGFLETPFELRPSLGEALGESGLRAWVKNETVNVSGSHKARHLMGIMLYLQVAERVGALRGRPPLAIASCGNAALAAAVVARAASWPLQVFVPPAASPTVLARLEQLGACITICRREPGIAGDPCYLAFRRAVEGGAVPFCCQGSDNGLTIEGGETLAWEMVDALGGVPLDALFVQVGGGALASAVVQGLHEACRDGAIGRLPLIYTVQTAGGYPLARAYDLLAARILASWPGPDEPPSGSPGLLAEAIAEEPALVDEAMAYARGHRSEFMWPWEDEPRSIAHGILDDETYDWAAVVEGMLRSGGRPVIVGEERLERANVLARAATGIEVDHTGSAGLAGLLDVLPNEPALKDGRVAVIFSGVRR
jgi:threonine synthase